MKLIPSKFLLDSINIIQKELFNKDIKFIIKIFPSDSWGCPNKVPIIGVHYSFYYPIFKAFEEDGIITQKEPILKIIRHEVGHCINYAYKFYEMKDWSEIFGNFNKPYKHPNSHSNEFKPNLNSRDFVKNLSDYNSCYSQIHPDEDFAETFAIWLSNTENSWTCKYADWKGALHKLNYVNCLINSWKNAKPKVKSGKKDKPYRFVKLS